MNKTNFHLPLRTLVGDHKRTQHHFPNSQVRRWATLCLASLLTTTTPAARAAVTEAWVQRYTNVVNSIDEAVKVVSDAAGDIIVAGYTDVGLTGKDILTIKYSGADGSLLWKRRYNGPANSDDQPQALAVDGSGNVVVTGSSLGSFDPWGNINADYFTAKYAAADGALLWEKRYNGSGNDYDSPKALAMDGSGNVVVAGRSTGIGRNSDYYTAKYAAADGALLWEHRYNGPADSDDQAQALAVDGSGDVVVTGFSSNGTNTDYYTAKYAAADGALLWEQRYNGPTNSNDFANALAVDGSGNVVVTGGSAGHLHSFGGYSDPVYDYYTAKYAVADGALLWAQRYNSLAQGDAQAQAVVVDGSGNVVVTGVSPNGVNNPDYYTAKYAAADGALLWEKRYYGNGPFNNDDRAQAVAVDAKGNVVVTGFSFNTNSTNPDYYTAKYAATDGALLWEKRYNGPGNQYDYAHAVTVDGTGNVVVTGFSDYDFYTVKYAEADGALLWAQRYNSLAQGEAQAQAVVVDGSGNVVVTGTANNGPPNFDDDYYTAKYAADGALLWDKRYNGPASSDDQAQAVAVDESGNVVVAGSSHFPYSGGSADHWDYYTVKYAAANGAVLWERRYDAMDGRVRAVAMDSGGNVVVTGSAGYANGFGRFLSFHTAKYAAADGALLWEKRDGATDGSDGAAAVAIDGSGNVVVTGLTNNGSGYYTGRDYYTAKYAAANGALLWEKPYNGPANGEDRGLAVAVDASGNVVVTGISSGTNDYDYYTAKYAAADGAVLWEKRYGGPANTDFLACSVAVDGGGNVVATGTSAFGAYLAKYAAADGAVLWEKRYDGPWFDQTQGVAVDVSGNVVVAGTFNTGFPTFVIDYYTAKYAATDGALLWEKRYNGPANGDDRVGGGRSLALGPNGIVAVTGSSSGDYATVVYSENLPPVSVAVVAAGIRLRFTGVPGRSYNIERAPAITGPWSIVSTQTAPASGLVEYLDTPMLSGQAFYRTVQP